MSKRVIKQLSDMAIDEVSLVDRGANQHALIAIAKNYSVDDIFAKARESRDEVDLDEAHGDDPAGVVDEHANGEGADTGAPAGKTISGTQKTSAEDITGKAGKAKGKKTLTRAPGRGGEDVPPAVIERHSRSSNHDDALGESFDETLQKSALITPDDEEYELAKRLGLFLDEDEYYEVEKGFGPQDPQAQQQAPQAPQMGNPPMAQSVGVQPMGMGAPQGPNPMAPGMPTGGPQMPGPTATPANPMAPMGMGAQPGVLGQVGTPPQLNVSQLPPEVIQYIQQLEKKVAEAQGQNSDSGAAQGPSTEGSDSSPTGSNSDSSDSSNKPFGKSGAFTMNEDVFYEELSKAIRDEDGRAEFSKALQARFEAYETEISKANELAASERDLRLEREFIAKAAEFSVPVPADELGPVLKRAAEALSLEDFGVIVKCLDAATELSDEVFGEVGKRGTGANTDVLGAVNAEVEELRKNFEVSPEQGVAAVFEANPAAYDEYRRNLPGFRG